MAPLGIQIGVTTGSSCFVSGPSEVNLLSGSEDFALPATYTAPKNSNWDKNYGFHQESTSVSADSPPAAANPRPGAVATDLTFLAGINLSGIRNTFKGPSNRYELADGEYTFSIWAKETPGKTSTRFRLRVEGYVGTSTSPVKAINTTSQVITSAWTRYYLTFTIGSGGDFSTGLNFALAVISSGSAGAGNNPGITIFGAMLNTGATAADYEYKPTNILPGPADPGFGGILDTYTGATSGYSVRRLSGAATFSLRVRRSSDDLEADMGFDSNGDLNTTGLLAFVNEERDIFTSDFPNGTSAGSGDGTLQATRTILTAPSSIGGETDALRVECDGTNASYDFRVKFMDEDNKHDVSFEYYIPSGNTIVEGIRLVDLSGAGTLTTKGAWTSVTFTDTIATNNILRFFATSSSGSSSIGSGVTESFYIRNLSVSQVTADGVVTTFYDQSGNGNNATNATASEQPFIVSAGSVINNANNNNAIKFPSGTDTHFTTGLTIDTDPFYGFSVIETSADTGYVYTLDENIDKLAFQVRSDKMFGFYGNGTSRATLTDTSTGIDVYQNTFIVDGTSNALRNNGVVGDSDTTNYATSGALTIHKFGGGNDLLHLSELIIYERDQSSNRTGIETNINDYFDIYT